MTAAAAPLPAAPAFNLIDEPWIPVRALDGQVRDVGLRALFEQGNVIAGLAEPSPPAFVALHRVLLVITHRALTMAYGRWDDDDRARWYREGLPVQTMVAYLEHWRERFWVFHPTHPFMQVAALAGATAADEPKPWTQIALDRSSGNNPVVFDHSVDAHTPPIAIGHAMRHLLAYLQCTPGGPVKVLRKDGNDYKGPLFDSAAVVPIGATLADSLVLGLHPAPLGPAEANTDIPSWEALAPALSSALAQPSPCTGPCDRYTRLTRSTLLLADPSGATVTRLRFAEGRAVLDDPNAPDPMSSHKQGKEHWVRLRFAEGRAVWRDLPALLPYGAGSAMRAAAIVGWARNGLEAAGADDQGIDLVVAGIAADKGKMLAARLERFDLPLGVLCRADSSVALQGQLARAEALHADLRHLASDTAAATLPDPKSKDTRSRARSIVDAGPLTTTYFAALERQLPRLLRDVGAGDIDAAHTLWSDTMRRGARQAWQSAGDLLGQSALALRARALAQGRFAGLLAQHCPAPAELPEPTP